MDYDHTKLAGFLHRTGHFWDPAAPSAANVTADDLGKLGKDHRLLKAAAASHQALDLNYELRSLAPAAMGGHGRLTVPDGDVGPVTLAMAATNRCCVPDFTPPAGAAFPLFSEDPEVQAGMEGVLDSMQANATGSGSWPTPGCDPKRPNRANEHSTRVNLDTRGASAHQKRILPEAMQLVIKCEAEMGQSVRFILDGDPQAAEHSISFRFLAGSLLGYNNFPQPNTCRQTVPGVLDSSYDASPRHLAILMVHEFKGHGDGLQHSRGGIENPSMLNINPLSWLGDPHERTKTRYFGGKPITDVVPPDPPLPPVDPAGNFPWVEGRDGYIRFHTSATQHYDFNATPRTRV